MRELTKDDIPTYAPETIELSDGSGRALRICVECDETMREPWKEHDGHGEVSEWTRRGKRPGEMVLAADRGLHLYYDYAATVKIALRDGWGCAVAEAAGEADGAAGGGKPSSRRTLAARAALEDFRRLRAWCRDEWQWIGVIVMLWDAQGNEIASDSLWGIESDTDYWREVAAELTNQLVAEAAEAAEHSAAADGQGSEG